MSGTIGALALAAVLLLGACSSSASGTAVATRPPVGRPSSATTSTPATTPHQTALGCADEAAPGTPPGPAALRVGGLAFDGLRDAGHALVPALLAVSAFGQRYHLLKAFLYVTEQASPTITVTVTAPPTARLYYTDATTWAAHPSDQQIIANATTSVTVQPCPDALAGYTGGILVQDATCVVLRVQGDHERQAHTVTVPIGLQRCR